MIKIGIVGSRRRTSREDFGLLIKACMETFREYEPTDITLVSGGCPIGADAAAEKMAESFCLPIIIHYPDKSKLPPNPKRWDFAKINYDRNTLIARDSDILIAIVAADRKGGTEDTVKKFKKLHPKGRLILI
jgi:hypothetical protein